MKRTIYSAAVAALLGCALPATAQTVAPVCPSLGNNAQFFSNADLGGANDLGILPYTFNYTVGTGTNRLLVILVSFENENPDVINQFGTATYGGQPMSLNVQQATGGTNTTTANRVGIFTLDEAGIGAALSNQVIITFDNANPLANYSVLGIAANAFTFQNVNQTTPISGAAANANAGTALPNIASGPVNYNNGDYVVAIGVSPESTTDFDATPPSFTMFNDIPVGTSHRHAVSTFAANTLASATPGFDVVTGSTAPDRLVTASARLNRIAAPNVPCNNVLPITLSSFEAQLRGAETALQWRTGTEEGASYFAIERSADGRTFDEVGRVAARGNSTETITYRYTDALPGNGVWHYRLRAVDADGSFTHSGLRTVRLEGRATGAIILSPNPARGALTVSGIAAGEAQVRILDGTGRVLKTAVVSPSAPTITLDGLATGMYYVQVVQDGRTISAQPLAIAGQ